VFGEPAGDHAGAVRCPGCGALNPRLAQWCGQCLARFESAVDDATPTNPPPASPASRSASPDRPAFRVSKDGVTWTCRLCETENPLESSVCSACSAPLAATLRPPEPTGPIRDPNTAALLSLFLPGAGHAYVGLWGQAAARAITSFWVLSVALVSALQQGPAAMPVVFGLVSFGLWAVTAHDAYRESRRERASVLLGDRSFLWLVLGLLVLSVVMVFASALGASR
jgi:hypothetical protein